MNWKRGVMVFLMVWFALLVFTDPNKAASIVMATFDAVGVGADKLVEFVNSFDTAK